MDTRPELAGEGPWQRFIIKYRGDSPPGRDTREVQVRLDAAAGTMGQGDSPGPTLRWLRRLGIGADVFQADRPLERAAARQLMETLAADPELEYVEVDGLMQACPQPGGPSDHA